MEFGNKDDLLLTKKIEHYASKLTWDKLGPMCKQMGIYDIYSESRQKSEEYIAHVEKTFAGRQQEKNRFIKLEKTAMLNEFILEYIIPRLIESGYFRGYEIPAKVVDGQRIFEYWEVLL